MGDMSYVRMSLRDLVDKLRGEELTAQEQDDIVEQTYEFIRQATPRKSQKPKMMSAGASGPGTENWLP